MERGWDYPSGRILSSAMARLYKRFEFERVLWTQGVTRIAGVDEAGRGPLAGPVVAAAAILPVRWDAAWPKELRGLNDSKQLTGNGARKILRLSDGVRRGGIRHCRSGFHGD